MSKGDKRKSAKERKVDDKCDILSLTKKQILVFLIAFLTVAAALLAVWYYLGEFYQSAIFFCARPILLAMGCPAPLIDISFSHVAQESGYLINFNLVPLVALAIATPDLALRRRLEMLAIGMPILFLLHVLDLVAHYPMDVYGSMLAQMVVYSIGVSGVAVPFIVWFAIAVSFRSAKRT